MQITLADVPSHLIPRLRASDVKVLNVLFGLFRARAAREPRRALYVVPGQKYMALKTSLNRSTISRSVSLLQRLKILSVTNRRAVDGIYQTNLYAIGSEVAKLLTRFCKRLKNGAPSRVRKTAHKDKHHLYSGFRSGDFPTLSTGPPGKGMSAVADIIGLVLPKR